MSVLLTTRATAARPAFTGLALAAAVLLILSNDASEAHAAVGDAGFLGAAESYAVLAHTTVTNDGALTLVGGDLGVSPGTAVTGFGDGQVTGRTSVGPSGHAALAKDSSSAAYVNIAGLAATGTYPSGEIGGSSPVPGVYSNAMQLTGVLTLNGDSDDVWVFQSGSTLTTAAGSSVVLLGDANPCNVFWQVGSSATLGTSTGFVGTVLAQASISLNTGAAVAGRLHAQTGAVTLLDNRVVLPQCTVPADEEVVPPADDDDTPPTGEETPPPTDEETPPTDGETPPTDEGTPPTGEGTPPTDEGTPPVDGGDEGVESPAENDDDTPPTAGGDSEGDDVAAGGGAAGSGDVTPTGATLPDTGSNPALLLMSGGMLSVLGAVVLIRARRRTAIGA